MSENVSRAILLERMPVKNKSISIAGFRSVMLLFSEIRISLTDHIPYSVKIMDIFSTSV